MSFAKHFEKIFRSILPSPFTITIILTLITITLALVTTNQSLSTLLRSWEKGIWDPNLLVFAFQMMLMLVLGHTLALTNSVNSLIKNVTVYCNNTANAAAIVCFLTIIISFFNWGLGLVFGAIFARKVGEHASEKNIKLNYPLIGACGYSGLMTWHGGLSGSIPIKVAEKNHLSTIINNPNIELPNMISISETTFSHMNIFVSLLLIILLPLSVYIIGKRNQGKLISLSSQNKNSERLEVKGAERLDHSSFLAYILSFIILGYCIYKSFILPKEPSLSVINPNFINLTLLGLGIALHSNFYKFTKAVHSAIGGAAGILIQFPLYFGIMAIMKDSGMATHMSQFFVAISNEITFPIYTFISAGIVNIFIPTGGGQWAVQGPIIIEAASDLGLSFNKSIMALAYGDQLTNMLQPFWAIPLLVITGLKAREIIPYTLYLFFIGCIIFVLGLLIF